MANDLKSQLHLFMERGIQPVSAEDIARHRARRRPRSLGKSAQPGYQDHAGRCDRRRVRRAGCSRRAGGNPGRRAGRCARHPPGSEKHPRSSTSAAAVLHLASASRLALAHAGRAVITSQQTLDGVLQQTSTDKIEGFTGSNWNDSFAQTFPARNGLKASTQSAINRVVNGQAYDYFVAADGLAWYHDTGPHAVNSMHIPDPRKLLAELAPDASFVKRFYVVFDHQRRGRWSMALRATVLAGLPAIDLPNLWDEGKLSAMDVWVDAHGVVRKMSLGFDQTHYPGTITLRQLRRLPKGTTVIGLAKLDKQDLRHIRVLLRKSGRKIIIEAEPGGSAIKAQTQLTTVTASFLGIGQRQIIRVPSHAIPAYGLG